MAQAHRQLLLKVARDAVHHGALEGRLLEVDVAAYPEPLRAVRATFVTLRTRGALRGCIGVTSALRPLVMDVAHNAYAAANRDPRFDPVRADELPSLDYSISILSPARERQVDSREHLLDMLDVGMDGLILEEGRRRAAFLPVMWEQITERAAFVAHLMSKGGWPPDYWSPQMRVWTFQSEYVS